MKTTSENGLENFTVRSLPKESLTLELDLVSLLLFYQKCSLKLKSLHLILQLLTFAW